MSGHNKWSKIKHKKAASDAQRSAIFGKLARSISVESKKVGGDVTAPSLRAAIEKARAVNMPKDNIERAVLKGTGVDATSLEEVLYEAYGPGGSALLIEGVTDNRSRTGAEIKHLLSKHGADLASPGAALWAFEKTLEGYEPKTKVALDDAEGEKIGSLIDALVEHDDVQNVYTTASE